MRGPNVELRLDVAESGLAVEARCTEAVCRHVHRDEGRENADEYGQCARSVGAGGGGRRSDRRVA